MTDNVTNAALRTIFQTLMAMPDNSVRPAMQNAPIVKGEQYITVQIISEVAEGTDETLGWQDIDDLHANELLSGVRLTSANIQYYNGDAISQLRLLMDRLQSAVGTQLLADAGLGYSTCTGPQDLTGLLPDVEWQTRATMRFDFYTEHNDSVPTPLIVTIPISIYSDDGQTRNSEVTP